MEQDPATEARHFKPSRSELASPENDWEKSWHLARQKGLGPEMTSFLWKLLHRLLPTQDRISRILKNKSPVCQLCQGQVIEDQPHVFFQCRFNGDSGSALLDYLATLIPGLSQQHALTLNFRTTAPQEDFPLVWFTGFYLHNIWDARSQKKQPQLFSIRADLEARVSSLRETRLTNEAILIGTMIENCFSRL